MFLFLSFFFFFKQKTAYEMRISDWSSDVCSSDLDGAPLRYLVERRPILGGERPVDAAAGFDQEPGRPIVSFRFDAVGARRFGDDTAHHVASALATVLDGTVLSAPVIPGAITCGRGQLRGHSLPAEASPQPP